MTCFVNDQGHRSLRRNVHEELYIVAKCDKSLYGFNWLSITCWYLPGTGDLMTGTPETWPGW